MRPRPDTGCSRAGIAGDQFGAAGRNRTNATILPLCDFISAAIGHESVIGCFQRCSRSRSHSEAPVFDAQHQSQGTIVRPTGSLPSPRFQRVRYHGWYSNKMRGQRLKRADAEADAADAEGEIIDVSAFETKPETPHHAQAARMLRA